jgi:ABC-type transport system involved in cytochrome bd biosynthesis fused ATPase/permease subunit
MIFYPIATGGKSQLRLIGVQKCTFGLLNADRIFVLINGKIVQSGAYAELIEQLGPFVELAKRQLA